MKLSRSAYLRIGSTGFQLGQKWTAAAYAYNTLGSEGFTFRTLFGALGANGEYGDRQLIIPPNQNVLGWMFKDPRSRFPFGFQRSSFNTENLVQDGWHHWVVVGIDNATLFYVDGEFVGSATWQSFSNIFTVGNVHESLGGNQDFAEQIDDVYIYERALSPAEIIKLYEAGNCTKKINHYLVGTMEVDGGGLPNADLLRGESSLTLNFSHLPGFSQVSRVDVKIGPLNTSISRSLTANPLPASTVTGFILDSKIWCDNITDLINGCGIVRVVLQARYAVGSSQLRDTMIYVGATLASFDSLMTTCTTSSLGGMCVAELLIPASWFSNTSTREVNISIGLSSNVMWLLNSTFLQKKLTYAVVKNVAVNLPKQDFFLGNTFSVDIVGHSGASISTFTLKLSFGKSLLLSQVKFNSIFTGQSLIDGNSLGVTAFLSDIQSSSSDLVEAIRLCTLTFKVVDLPNANTSANISGSIISLSDIMGQSVFAYAPSNPTPITFIDRSGITTGRNGGSLNIIDDVVMGIFPYSLQSEFVNVASFNGEPIRSPIIVTSVTRSGKLSATSQGLYCLSEAVNVIQVEQNCTNIFLNGNETAGGSEVEIRVSFSTFTATFPVRVWYSVEQSFSLRDNYLSPIYGWNNEKYGCNQGYQKSDVLAEAKFSYHQDAPQIVLSIAALIKSNLVSNDPTVATVDKFGVVTGSAPGDTVISVYAYNGRLLGVVPVAVSNIFTNIIQLDLKPIVSISVSEISSSGSYLGGNILLRVSLSSLNKVGQLAFIQAVAYFDDGNDMEITTEHGLVLSADRENAIDINGQMIKLLSSLAISGTEKNVVLSGKWISSNCGRNDTIASATRFLTTDMLLPSAIYVDQYVSVLTVPGDVTSILGVSPLAVNSLIRIQLVFPDRSTQLATDDPKIIFNTSFCSQLFSVQIVLGKVTLVPNLNRLSGTGELLIQYAGSPLVTSVTITIVTSLGISVSMNPFPSFSNSDALIITELQRIGDSSVMQQGILKTMLLLSNNSTRDISTDNLVKYTVFASHNDSTLDSTLNGNRVQLVQKNVLVVSNQTVFGTIWIGVRIVNISGNHRIRLGILNSSVQIAAFKNLVLSRNMVGFVRHSQRIFFDVIFNDGTIYSRQALFEKGIISIVSFVSNNTRALSIDASGNLTLLENSATPVNIILAAKINRNVNASEDVLCNLVPDVGDVDLGLETGTPLEMYLHVGMNFEVNVRLNSGLDVVGAVDLTLLFNQSHVQLTGIRKGPSWGAGAFLVSSNNVAGQISFGGLPSSISGMSVVVALATFKVLPAALNRTVSLSGLINTFSTLTNQKTIGNSVLPRRFIAGAIFGYVNSQTLQKREILESELKFSYAMLPVSGINRRKICNNAPCSSCESSRPFGDANGDCVFDLNDALFTQQYIISQLFSASQSNRTISDAQLANMDLDSNGIIDSIDTYVSLQINFNLLQIINNVIVDTPSPKNNCTLHINISLIAAANKEINGNLSAIFFDLETTDVNTSLNLQMLNLTTGSVVTSKRSANYNGVIWRATYLGNGVYGVSANVSSNLTDVGLSIIQVSLDSFGIPVPGGMITLIGSPSNVLYTAALSLQLPVEAGFVTLKKSNGYNPFMIINNSHQKCLPDPPEPSPWKLTLVTSINITNLIPQGQSKVNFSIFTSLRELGFVSTDIIASILLDFNINLYFFSNATLFAAQEFVRTNQLIVIYSLEIIFPIKISATANTLPTTTSNTNPANPLSPVSAATTISDAVIAGSAVGGTIALLIVLFLVFSVVVKRRQRNEGKYYFDKDTEPVHGGPPSARKSSIFQESTAGYIDIPSSMRQLVDYSPSKRNSKTDNIGVTEFVTCNIDVNEEYEKSISVFAKDAPMSSV